MHAALKAIRDVTIGTRFENQLFLVGGAVRDELLGLPVKTDFDLVTTESASDLAYLLFESRVSAIAPVTYERFGTAMVRVHDVDIELVTARKESYDPDSRKPNVEPATYEEDAKRRDFTANTLQRGLHSGALRDPLGVGLADLEARVLRTPLDPAETFRDDPLRMLRAVRFRWKLDFTPAPGLYEAVTHEAHRLAIVSAERIRDELNKILLGPNPARAFADLRSIGLVDLIFPELSAMVGCDQGHYHHLDVWDHSLLVLTNLVDKAPDAPLNLRWAAFLHDIGKPSTRFVDDKGHIRFFTHESVGAEMAREILRRLKFSAKDIDEISKLVRHHMRLGSATDFTPAAARRLLRDFEGEVEPLLALINADASSLAPGVRKLDLQPVRDRIEEVQTATPTESLTSPLSGADIMALTGLPPGKEVGRIKQRLTEWVLEGRLNPYDRIAASQAVQSGDLVNPNESSADG